MTPSFPDSTGNAFPRDAKARFLTAIDAITYLGDGPQRLCAACVMAYRSSGPGSC